ncbi:hypothetical protein [Halosimplex amylolyticum]|uniref:hypothetical protein n=1 Tax=Halosimplex amylolyticum TaxID=3396616 RepID=UPI003F57BC5F
MSQPVERRLGYRVRSAVGPWLDRAVRSVVPETYRVYPSAYAGTFENPIEDLESRLSEYGFRWNPVSMYHYTQLGNQTNGSWVYRESPLADRQLHAVLVRQESDRIDVYAHEEFNWRRHPLKHLQDAGIDRDRGSKRMRRVLDELDAEYVEESYVRRKASHLLRRLRRRPAGGDRC